MEELDIHLDETPEKLVAQCYNGSTVLSGPMSHVQGAMKLKYQYAHFIHWSAH
jgi:hypothetical protein